MFEKNSKHMFYKVSHKDVQFQEVDFIMKKTQSDADRGVYQLKVRMASKGILYWKKNHQRSLPSHACPQKKVFWKNLATNEGSSDLT